MEHLVRERAYIETLATVEQQLEQYRIDSSKAIEGTRKERLTATRAMLAEKHHPTKELMKYMRAAGRPKPSAEHTAHHIVSGKGRTTAMARTRLHLHTVAGVGINDPDNGA